MPNQSTVPIGKKQRGRGRPRKDGKKKPAYRPPKPYRDYPLTAVSTGYWTKRISGKLFYFGRWGERNAATGKMERLPDDGWEAALKLYNAQQATAATQTESVLNKDPFSELPSAGIFRRYRAAVTSAPPETEIR